VSWIRPLRGRSLLAFPSLRPRRAEFSPPCRPVPTAGTAGGKPGTAGTLRKGEEVQRNDVQGELEREFGLISTGTHLSASFFENEENVETRRA
jgi:hypothetical protein